MDEVRIIGRSSARAPRCVFCHDDLAPEEIASCPACAATWHPDCARGAASCPTRGCAGPPPDPRAPRRPTTIVRPAPPPAPPAPPAPHPRPGPWARVGPYARLALAATLTSLGALASGGIVLALLVNTPRLLREVASVHDVELDIFVAFVLGLLLLVAGFGLRAAVRWLRGFPGLAREVRRLLDEETPEPMVLGVRAQPAPGGTTYWAILSGQGVHRELRLSGLFPPWWLLRERRRAEVHVYGLRSPGPCIIEFADGWLALVHPDPE
jgi:hypothetical protein